MILHHQSHASVGVGVFLLGSLAEYSVQCVIAESEMRECHGIQ